MNLMALLRFLLSLLRLSAFHTLVSEGLRAVVKPVSVIGVYSAGIFGSHRQFAITSQNSLVCS